MAITDKVYLIQADHMSNESCELWLAKSLDDVEEALALSSPFCQTVKEFDLSSGPVKIALVTGEMED